MTNQLRRKCIALVGPSRCGKDQAGRFLGAQSTLRYTGSLSWYGKSYVAQRLGMCEQEAWDTRHENRMAWRRLLDEFRKDDPCRLIRMAMEAGELVVGIRSTIEIATAKKENLFDEIVWIQRDIVPHDPTLEFGIDVATIVIPNNGGLEDLEDRMGALARHLGVLKPDLDGL